MVEPQDVNDHQEAMKLCLAQDLAQGRYPILLENQQGTWGNTTIFSPFHSAFRLQEAAHDEFCTYRYSSFTMDNGEDERECFRTSFECLEPMVKRDVGVPLVNEVMEIFQQATIHWGLPQLSAIGSLDNGSGRAIHAWPKPEPQEGSAGMQEEL